MAAFRTFEIEAIRWMASTFLSEEQIGLLRDMKEPCSYKYTGSGYFLSVRHPSLPVVSRTLSDPPVVGNVDEIQAGFVVFLRNGELTLECHTWGAVEVPSDFRDRAVVISTPPVNFVDLSDAT